jgi:hypothetical protein
MASERSERLGPGKPGPAPLLLGALSHHQIPFREFSPPLHGPSKVWKHPIYQASPAFQESSHLPRSVIFRQVER